LSLKSVLYIAEPDNSVKATSLSFSIFLIA
jgi:hypothetical protein